MLEEYSGIQVDAEWLVQGRIIPSSCRNFSDSVLALQVTRIEWKDFHYHTGICPVPPDLAVELVSSICVPFNTKLVCKSFDFQEQTEGLYYLQMVKLARPLESLAFLTTSGDTITLKIDGVGELFSRAKDCKECNSVAGVVGIDDSILDQMLVEVGTNVREH